MVRTARIVLFALFGAALASAALPGHAADVAGSKDHPLVGRFSGAEIHTYQQLDYDEAAMPDQAIPKESEAKTLVLEGKVTRIGYRIDGSKSALEVFRNYQDTVRAGGFKTVFECKGDEQCGGDFQSFVLNGDKVRPPGVGDAAFGGKYYVALAKKEAPSGDVYAFLDVMQDESNKRTLVFLQVVEVKAMQTGQVSLPDATAMQKALTESGKVAVYGVYFDTDKADVKAESKAALDEMGKLLQAAPHAQGLRRRPYRQPGQSGPQYGLIAKARGCGGQGADGVLSDSRQPAVRQGRGVAGAGGVQRCRRGPRQESAGGIGQRIRWRPGWNPERKRPILEGLALAYLAERVGFEPTVRGYRTPDFESGTFDHSATSPWLDSVTVISHLVISHWVIFHAKIPGRKDLRCRSSEARNSTGFFFVCVKGGEKIISGAYPRLPAPAIFAQNSFLAGGPAPSPASIR